MAHITKNFFEFFKELEQNNNREWFQENKKRYDGHVRGPFVDLVEVLLAEVEKLDPTIVMNGKDALFRINRDIRFSKDKTPYNTMMKAAFAKDGRKSGNAGYYLGLGIDGLHVGGGMYDLDKERLERVREHIKQNPDEFLALIAEKKFRSSFGTVRGEQNKRIPAELKDIAEKVPMIANKQFYYMAHLKSTRTLVGEKLQDTILQHFQVITPINAFLNQAL